MARQHHYLKTETEFFKAVEKGEKKFEVRKNDRDFKEYDIICLQETVNGIKTGRVITRIIKYIFYGGKYGLDKEYCIINW